MIVSRFVILYIILAAFFLSCSDPTEPTTDTGKDSTGDSTGDSIKRSFFITPDSASIQLNDLVSFRISASPRPLQVPYSVIWWINTTHSTRANTDTFTYVFTSAGVHSVKAVYLDSTGSALDSVSTIVTVADDTPQDTTDLGLPPIPGSFRFVVNGDTLDRTQRHNFCDAIAALYQATIDGAPAHRIGITFNYSKNEYNVGFGEYQLMFFVGLKTLGASTHLVQEDGDQLGCYARQRVGSTMSSTIPGSGSFTVTEINTAQKTISGFFSVVVAQWDNPSAMDTVKGSFRNVCFQANFLGQGTFTATAGDAEFSPDYKEDLFTANYVPGTNVLSLHGTDSDPGQTLQIDIYAPKVGTFPLAWPPAPGKSMAGYTTGSDIYSVMYKNFSGSVTITNFDMETRRASGTFECTLKSDKGKVITVANGVIDNIVFARN